MVSEASKVGDYVAHVNVDDLDTGDNGLVQLTVGFTIQFIDFHYPSYRAAILFDFQMDLKFQPWT